MAMEAYISVISALGLQLKLIDPKEENNQKPDSSLPKKIRLENYKQLKKIAWQMDPKIELTPEEVLNLYERNWRHVNVDKMDAKEKRFLQHLLKTFKRERLLV